MREVRDMEITGNTSFEELIEQMDHAGGFNAKHLAVGTKILKKMVRDKKCLKFLSFPADIVSTGIRGVIRDLVKEKFFDIIITTCGTLDHDLARSYKKYFQGTFYADDRELRKMGINRLGNIFVPDESYSLVIEEKMQKFLNKIYSEGKRVMATYELCWELGKWINRRDSILYWCYRNKIPFIVPGITDGAVGYQIWLFSQDHDFRIDLMKDEKLLNESVWNVERCGALMVGGGISKHHVIWWAQFGKGLDYAVYITTAHESDGSLSGARTHEAISWGKIKQTAEHITIEGDATVYLPLIFLISRRF